MTNAGPMEIEYGSAVKVNGRTWDRVESTPTRTLIADRDSMKPLVVVIVFQRTGKSKTLGMLSVLGSEPDAEPRCGNSVKLDGTYVP